MARWRKARPASTHVVHIATFARSHGPRQPDTANGSTRFNPAAFQPVTSGTFGNEQRNGLRGPKYKSLDFSLQRRLAFTPKVNAVLRWDVFNALNRVNFGLPNRNITDTVNVGTITSLGGDPRLMQVSLRLSF